MTPCLIHPQMLSELVKQGTQETLLRLNKVAQ